MDVPTYNTSQNGEIPLIIDLIALALNLSRDCRIVLTSSDEFVTIHIQSCYGSRVVWYDTNCSQWESLII